MFYQKGDSSPYEASEISIRCPSCRHQGMFCGLEGLLDSHWSNGEGRENGLGDLHYYVGLRRCPNLECAAVVMIGGSSDDALTVMPPEIIDFDATSLPADIRSTLEEAINCHAAGCYRASALMVRRTLEELCDDKSAGGGNLKARISALSSVAVIPTELLSAADELRILGNDAAHIEAKDYDKIGKEESELAIELATSTNKAKVGLVTIRYAKGKALKADVAEWQSSFLFGYCGYLDQEEGAEPDKKLCITVDGYTGACIPAPGNVLTRLKNMDAACAGIAERWANIPPPPKAVL